MAPVAPSILGRTFSSSLANHRRKRPSSMPLVSASVNFWTSSELVLSTSLEKTPWATVAKMPSVSLAGWFQ